MPAILLARMAVDSRHNGHGLGAALLKHFMLKAFEVAQSVGVRVLLIHAKDEEAKVSTRTTESPNPHSIRSCWRCCWGSPKRFQLVTEVNA